MDLKTLLLDFIIGGILVVGALGLAMILGPVFGGVFAGAPIRAGTTIFLAGLHRGADFATEVTKGTIFSMIGNVFFVVALYFSLPRLGLYKGFLVSGIIFAVLVALLIKFSP
ncbi:MAG: DUF3147 family protein [Hadesarchaea archaeon]|nr:DUF3147 family protein [Hadesarchaea archaeon]